MHVGCWATSFSKGAPPLRAHTTRPPTLARSLHGGALAHTHGRAARASTGTVKSLANPPSPWYNSSSFGKGRVSRFPGSKVVCHRFHPARLSPPRLRGPASGALVARSYGGTGHGARNLCANHRRGRLWENAPGAPCHTLRPGRLTPFSLRLPVAACPYCTPPLKCARSPSPWSRVAQHRDLSCGLPAIAKSARKHGVFVLRRLRANGKYPPALPFPHPPPRLNPPLFLSTLSRLL